MTKRYIRDKRSPIPKSKNVSRIMSGNKSKNTKIEVLLRKEMWRVDLKGYRLHYKKVPGKPDIAFVSKKIAIFVNGCFWHRCPHCNMKLPNNNLEFWQVKFNNNVERDKKKSKDLLQSGWKVITLWECELKNEMDKQIEKIKVFYAE